MQKRGLGPYHKDFYAIIDINIYCHVTCIFFFSIHTEYIYLWIHFLLKNYVQLLINGTAFFLIGTLKRPVLEIPNIFYEIITQNLTKMINMP